MKEALKNKGKLVELSLGCQKKERESQKEKENYEESRVLVSKNFAAIKAVLPGLFGKIFSNYIKKNGVNFVSGNEKFYWISFLWYFAIFYD